MPPRPGFRKNGKCQRLRDQQAEAEVRPEHGQCAGMDTPAGGIKAGGGEEHGALPQRRIMASRSGPTDT